MFLILDTNVVDVLWRNGVAGKYDVVLIAVVAAVVINWLLYYCSFYEINLLQGNIIFLSCIFFGIIIGNDKEALTYFCA